MAGPIERVYGHYRIIFRKSEHLQGRPTPHVEVWKDNRKIGNYDMASGEPLPGWKPVHNTVKEFLRNYIRDPQVQKKISEAIKESFFDLSKVAGQYGGIPKGFKVEIKVEIQEYD